VSEDLSRLPTSFRKNSCRKYDLLCHARGTGGHSSHRNTTSTVVELFIKCSMRKRLLFSRNLIYKYRRPKVNFLTEGKYYIFICRQKKVSEKFKKQSFLIRTTLLWRTRGKFMNLLDHSSCFIDVVKVNPPIDLMKHFTSW
jgi:hypothetical protein